MKADLFDGLLEPNKKTGLPEGRMLDGQSDDRCGDQVVSSEPVMAVGIVDCELCVVRSAIFDLGLLCCKVRYILGEPRLEIRRAWLERWAKKDREASERVSAEVLVKWEKLKSVATKGGKRGRGA